MANGSKQLPVFAAMLKISRGKRGASSPPAVAAMTDLAKVFVGPFPFPGREQGAQRTGRIAMRTTLRV